MKNHFLMCAVWGCISIGAVQGQGPPLVDTVRVTSPDPRGRPVGRWNGSGLAFQDNSAVVFFADAQGTVTPIALTIPGATEVHITDAGHRSGDAFVLLGWAADQDKRIVSFLAFAFSDNRPTQIMRTYPYAPQRLGVAQDGSIWTYGYEVTTPGHLSNTDAGMIRHFDASGSLLGSYLPQSSIDRKEDRRPGLMTFAVASHGAGWYQGPARYYFEVIDGKVQKYPGIPDSECDLPTGARGAAGLALTDNGGVFVTYQCGNARRVYSLNRTAGRWSPVDMPNGEYFLAGGYGNNLVFYSPADSRNYVIYDVSQWSPH